MPYFEALGDNPDEDSNHISAEISDTIETIQALSIDATLPDIINQLHDKNGWYPHFYRNGNIPLAKASWLYALRKTHDYNEQNRTEEAGTNPDEVPIVTNIANIEIDMAALYKQANQAPSLNLIVSLLPILQNITSWIKNEMQIDKKKDVDLMLSFLIIARTTALQLDELPFFLKHLIGSTNIERLKKAMVEITSIVKAKLAQHPPEEEERIAKNKEFEAKITTEQLLDRELVITHRDRFNQGNEPDNISFTKMDTYLIERTEQFEVLFLLKSIQNLLTTNEEKTIGREYFSSLIGVKKSSDPDESMDERAFWFESMMNVCSADDKAYWLTRRHMIKNPLPLEQSEKNVLYAVSTLCALPLALARGIWGIESLQVPLQKILDSPVIQSVSNYSQTQDSKDKKDFMVLVNAQINAICKKISTENPALAQKLSEISVENVKDIQIKTDYIRRLYHADKQLFDFIKEHDTLYTSVNLLLSKYGLSRGPSIAGLLEKAASYQDTIEGLRQSVYRGGVTEARIRSVEKAVNDLQLASRHQDKHIS